MQFPIPVHMRNKMLAARSPLAYRNYAHRVLHYARKIKDNRTEHILVVNGFVQQHYVTWNERADDMSMRPMSLGYGHLIGEMAFGLSLVKRGGYTLTSRFNTTEWLLQQ